MRTLAIGDIHGCLHSLEQLARYVGFQEDDVIITLGDYVDRGPDSKGVIDFLLNLRKTHEVVTLRGNHEIMMLEAVHSETCLNSWLGFGGKESLASYGSSFDEGPEAHWEFMKKVNATHETENHFFVHANADPSAPIYAQPDEMLYWQRFGKPRPHVSGKTMVCGHTIQRSGEPLSVGHAICIDTWAYGKGWLTCLDVETGNYWQTNEQGQRRAAKL
ncbi:MAG: serine/threonine protein phosphatase [Verrucomicrobiaceae bacterium]|nr:serine/threonine protein phosphatase [Verrucomicrobiaceae bacterium]